MLPFHSVYPTFTFYHQNRDCTGGKVDIYHLISPRGEGRADTGPEPPSPAAPPVGNHSSTSSFPSLCFSVRLSHPVCADHISQSKGISQDTPLSLTLSPPNNSQIRKWQTEEVSGRHPALPRGRENLFPSTDTFTGGSRDSSTATGFHLGWHHLSLLQQLRRKHC